MKRHSDKSRLIDKLDKVFSQYIRLKDATPGTGYVRCFTSGRVYHWRDIQCGHYCSRRNMATRWSVMNCHPQSMEQNVFQHGNLLVYRRRMVETYGEQAVDELEARARTVKKWSTAELEQMVKYYTILVDKLKKNKGL